MIYDSFGRKVTLDEILEYVMSYMNTRCDVRSQHKLPTREELDNTMLADLLGGDNVAKAVELGISRGQIIDYDGYLSDHPIDVL